MGRLFIIIVLLFPAIIGAQTTFYDDVAPILKHHCVSCHSSGEVGPMPLVTYEEVASYAAMIKFVTNVKLMPPFKANYHKVKYKNERSISKEEITTIEDWIAEGLVQGEPTSHNSIHSQPKKSFDDIICMEESFEHYGIYYDQYQAFAIPLDYEEDRYVSQIEVLPGNKEIVRSAYISITSKGDANKMDNWDPKYGFYAYGSLGFEPALPNWYSWMPNTKGLEINRNEYSLMPKDSELILHLHYGPYGEIQNDSTCIGLVFDDDKRDKAQLQNVPLLASDFLKDTFLLEPNLKKRFSSSFYIPEDLYIKSITPLSYLLCRSWEVFAVFPDKSAFPLLSISDWDFHWREKYVFDDYILLPKGTRIVGNALYDNTSQNPYNPSDPPHAMEQGPHMFDENFKCYFEFITPNIKSWATIHKPFTVTTSNISNLVFTCEKEGNYSLTLHNLSDGSSRVMSEKIYPKGKHNLRSSELPQLKGRYAISISLENDVQDIWVFVVE